MQLRRTRRDDILNEVYLTPVTLRRRPRPFSTSFVIVFGDGFIDMKVLDDDGIVRDMTAYDIELSTSLS